MAKTLSEQHLADIIAGGESERVEFTVSTGKVSKFGAAICAFSNDFSASGEKGYLIIGLDDNGSPTGMDIDDTLLKTLSEIRDNGKVLPYPIMHVEKLSYMEHDIAVVTVTPSTYPPVRYDGSSHRRAGPRSVKTTQAEECILNERRVSLARSFDSSPVTGAGVKEISRDMFNAYRDEAVSREIIEENGRDYEEQLASLQCYHTGKDCLTYGALIAFGINTRHYLPGAYVQFLRINGADLSDSVLEQAEISGDITYLVRELALRIRTHNNKRLENTGIIQERSPIDYPEEAIKQLVMNAVLHRNYGESNAPVRFYWFNDRIEIQNPGGLYGETKRKDNISADAYVNPIQGNDYRNPILAAIMKDLGYVNRFGSGITRAQKALEKNGNPPAAFEIEDNIILVTVKKASA